MYPSPRHERDITEGLILTSMQTIDRPTTGITEDDIEARNVRYLGSYNWTGASSPTMVVPGSPPEWRDRPMPYNVLPDTGLAVVDQNSFRMSSIPLVPFMTAVEICKHDIQAEFNWASADFVTDRSGLRNLLRWILGTSARDFRIDMQLAGSHGFSFGSNFEKASTTPSPGCEERFSHHRIISYDLNGLKMVVRSEVDACIPSPSQLHTPRPSPNVDSAESLAATAPSTTARSDDVVISLPSHHPSTLTVKIGGSYQIPQSCLIELTTRTVKKEHENRWMEAYPQLFFSQTPHRFLAVHQGGTFIAVTKRSVDSEEVRKAGARMQPSLRKLRRALDLVKEMVIKSGKHGRLSLVCRNQVLAVFERASKESCLPDDFMRLFDIGIEAR